MPRRCGMYLKARDNFPKDALCRYRYVVSRVVSRHNDFHEVVNLFKSPDFRVLWSVAWLRAKERGPGERNMMANGQEGCHRYELLDTTYSLVVSIVLVIDLVTTRGT